MPGPSQNPDTRIRVIIDRPRHARPIPETRHQDSGYNRQVQTGHGPFQIIDSKQFIIDRPRHSRISKPFE
jgi:hypothetical protein